MLFSVPMMNSFASLFAANDHYLGGASYEIRKLHYLGTALRVNKHQGVRVEFLCCVYFRSGKLRVSGTAAVNQLDLLFRDLLLDVITEVTVRNEQDLVRVHSADYLNRRGGCDAHIGTAS